MTLNKLIREPYKKDRCNGCPLLQEFTGEDKFKSYCKYDFQGMIITGEGACGSILKPMEYCHVKKIVIYPLEMD